MEKAELINKIYQEYNRALLRDERTRLISRAVQDGTATYAEAYELAESTGKIIGDIVYQNLEEVWGTMSFEDATELIPRSLKENHDYVTSVTEQIEKTINEQAEVALKPLKPDFDNVKAREIASDVAEGVSKDKFLTECETFSRRTVDKSAQINAAAKEKAGLTVKVTRKYDDVGLSNGRTCTWCLARECEDMPYSEAYALGAFERHDGCGCLIEYTNARGEMTWQDAKGGWHEANESKKTEARKIYGINDEKISPIDRVSSASLQEGENLRIPEFLEGSFEDCHPLAISNEDRATLRRIYDEVQKSGCEYGEIITSKEHIPCESNLSYKVRMDTSGIDEYNLKLYHGHTNDTLPSEGDLFRFVYDEKVGTIGVITGNADVFIVTVGDGYIPNEKEYWDIAQKANNFARSIVAEKYDLTGLPSNQIEYLIVREKNTEIIHQLGWRIEGGKL